MAQFIHKGEQKKKYVKQMFNDISKTYDLINILSSFGIDRYWRRSLIKRINLSHNSKLLDVATGTGDVAFGFLKKYNDYAYYDAFALYHITDKLNSIFSFDNMLVNKLRSIGIDYIDNNKIINSLISSYAMGKKINILSLLKNKSS